MSDLTGVRIRTAEHLVAPTALVRVAVIQEAAAPG